MPNRVVINAKSAKTVSRDLSHFNNPVTVDMVNQEASRRILSIFPEWKQRNAIARSTELQEKRLDGDSLTAAELTEVSALKALWTSVKSIRSASNVLSALSPIPANYTDDEWWT